MNIDLNDHKLSYKLNDTYIIKGYEMFRRNLVSAITVERDFVKRGIAV